MKIHIIGGGIIGLSTAWYLTEQGVEVTLIDDTDLTDGTSHGNAGMIVPSHFVPLASPGIITQGMKWLFDSKSPFYVKPRIDIDFFQWLWRFYRSCSVENVKKATPILRDFNELSRDLYNDFATQPDFEFAYEKKGLLMLYQTKHQQEDEIEFAEKANEIGMAVEILNETQLRQLEPEVKINAIGGIYFPNDTHLYPNLFIKNAIEQLKRKGVKFILNKKVNDITVKNGKVCAIKLANNEEVSVNKLVVTGGSWTAKILKKAGVKLLLQDGKGYSFTLKNMENKPQIPTILTEGKVAVTPMGNDLRIGGTLEISNLSKEIKRNRLKGIHETMKLFYPEIEIAFPENKDVWVGYRPCSADGLPYIGNVDVVKNLFVGTGHGMMGMSLGPATGKLLSEQILNLPKSIDDSLFRVGRF